MGLIRVVIFTSFFSGLLLFSTTAIAGSKAFVIGNQSYQNLPVTKQLTNPTADAGAIASRLIKLGFKVQTGINLKRSSFNQRWQGFLNDISPDDSIALYYSGHGIDIEGATYLLPADIPYVKSGRQEQLKRESISVAELILDLKKRQPKFTLIILDACRDNPMIAPEYKAFSSSSKGLSPTEPKKGVFIMYAASAGESAIDTLPEISTNYSLFTEHLIRLLDTEPHLDVASLARKLKLNVYKDAKKYGYEQNPAYYDGLIGDHWLSENLADIGDIKVLNTSKDSDELFDIDPSERVRRAMEASIDLDKTKLDKASNQYSDIDPVLRRTRWIIFFGAMESKPFSDERWKFQQLVDMLNANATKASIAGHGDLNIDADAANNLAKQRLDNINDILKKHGLNDDISLETSNHGNNIPFNAYLEQGRDVESHSMRVVVTWE